MVICADNDDATTKQAEKMLDGDRAELRDGDNWLWNTEARTSCIFVVKGWREAAGALIHRVPAVHRQPIRQCLAINSWGAHFVLAVRRKKGPLRSRPRKWSLGRLRK